MLSAIRPDSWNLPLLLHVLGASILLGALATAVTFQLLGWRHRAPADALPFARLTFRTLLFVGVPSWILMRAGAEWIASREGWDDVDATPLWLAFGALTADAGALLLLVSIVLAGIGARELGRSDGARGVTLVRIATVLVALVAIAYVLVTWAMAAKPT